MTPPKKPDWIEIADNDGGSKSTSTQSCKEEPSSYVVAMRLRLVLTFRWRCCSPNKSRWIWGYSAAFNWCRHRNQPQWRHPALSAVTPQFNISKFSSSSVQSPSIKAPSIGKNTLPAIATPPNMNGGDDDEDDDDEDEDEDDDDRDDH